MVYIGVAFLRLDTDIFLFVGLCYILNKYGSLYNEEGERQDFIFSLSLLRCLEVYRFRVPSLTDELLFLPCLFFIKQGFYSSDLLIKM